MDPTKQQPNEKQFSINITQSTRKYYIVTVLRKKKDNTNGSAVADQSKFNSAIALLVFLL